MYRSVDYGPNDMSSWRWNVSSAMLDGEKGVGCRVSCGACFQDLNGYGPRICKDINRGLQLVGCRAIQEQVVRCCDLWTEHQWRSMVD